MMECGEEFGAKEFIMMKKIKHLTQEIPIYSLDRYFGYFVSILGILAFGYINFTLI